MISAIERSLFLIYLIIDKLSTISICTSNELILIFAELVEIIKEN